MTTASKAKITAVGTYTLVTVTSMILTSVSMAHEKTLCNTSEVIVFNCSLTRNEKIVSLCASRQLTNSVGYVQYRFGTPKHTELEFPSERQASILQFQMSHYFRPMVSHTSISFENQRNRYSIVDDIDDEDGFKRREIGINVVAANGKHIFLRCKNGHQANFSHIEGIIPCEEEDSMTCNK